MATQQIKLSISVIDVDNEAVSGFSVQCYWRNTAVGNIPAGASVFECTLEADVPPNVVSDVKITVSHPNFFTEETYVHPEGTHWTNPTCMVTPTASPATVALQVKFVLSRVRLALLEEYARDEDILKC